MTRAALTAQQQDVLDRLRDFTNTHGYPPSIRTLCDLTSLSSTSSVAHILTVLQARGYIVREEGQARAITVLPNPDRGDGEGLPSEDLTWGDLDTAALVVVAAPDGTVRVWTEDGTPHADHAVALRAIADRIDPPVMKYQWVCKPCGAERKAATMHEAETTSRDHHRQCAKRQETHSAPMGIWPIRGAHPIA